MAVITTGAKARRAAALPCRKWRISAAINRTIATSVTARWAARARSRVPSPRGMSKILRGQPAHSERSARRFSPRITVYAAITVSRSKPDDSLPLG